MTLPQAAKPDIGTTDKLPADEVVYNGKAYNKVREGLADILNPRSPQADENGKTKQSVFYNPIQQFNRDLSVLAIQTFAEDLAIIRLARQERRLQSLAKAGQKGKKRKRETSRAAGSREDVNRRKDSEALEQTSAPTKQHRSTHSNDAVEEASATPDCTKKQLVDSSHEASNGTSADGQAAEYTGGPTEELQDNQELSKHSHDHTEPDLLKSEKDISPNVTPPFRVLDALSATGLRALRYAAEIPQVTSVVANDLSSKATASIKLNIEYNGLAEKIFPTTSDAKTLMYRAAHRDRVPLHVKDHFHVVDLDPYGTAAPFLDAAVQAVTEGGLLCVTCTDSGVFASVGWPEKTFSQYGGLPWRGPQGHEAGLRLILHLVATSAARYGLAIEPLLSLHIDFYARLFIRVKRSPVDVKCLAGKTMVVYNCDHGCGSYTVQYLAHTREKEAKNGDKFHSHSLAQGPTSHPLCEHCGFKTHLAGPMWGGPLHNPYFIGRMLDVLPSLDRQVYGTIPRIEGMLTLALNETLFQDPPKLAPTEPAAKEPFASLEPALRDPHPFFVNPSTLSRTIHCSRPSDAAFRGALLGLGYRTTRSHTEPGSIRTDAPWNVIWEIMREWIRQKHPIKEGAITKGMAGWEILQKDRSQSKINEVRQELRKMLEGAENLDGLKEGLEAALYRISKPAPEVVDGSEELDTRKPSNLSIDFDEKLGKEVAGKKMVRYQQNPRPEWGPMSKAKNGS
ncbi:MAG: hypothetical protein Q9219_003914 [cf. Caloplaca sp. 3 TL-2023]